jgi:hypothetical protein
MLDLAAYKDLTDEGSGVDFEDTPAVQEVLSPPVDPSQVVKPISFTTKPHQGERRPMELDTLSQYQPRPHPEASESFGDIEAFAEYTGNVKTLVKLVSDLPEGVTKQTGAQIIRLTMEAMGISMETVLSEAQSAQSELLEAARSNIKKIEEYKTIIRKLETEIRYHQGKANELSEIIDLFILSNASSHYPDTAGD